MLPVVSNMPEAVQNCATCRLATHCWREALSTSAVALNLVVCRIKLGIDVQKNWTALFAMTRKKVLKLARYVRSGDLYNTPLDEYIAEIHAVMVSAINEYVMGDRVHPAAWLFQPHFGAVSRWQKTQFRARDTRRKHDTLLIDATPGQLDGDNLYLEAALAASVVESDVEEVAGSLQNVLEVVNDGHTLTTREYRIARLAMEHHARPLKTEAEYVKRATGLSIRGLLLNLATLSRKLAARAGKLEAVADRLGVVVDGETRATRARRLAGMPTPLTPKERAQILGVRLGKDREFALLFGVDVKTIWAARKLTRSGRA